ncbi:MAG: DNA mismatch repair protein MutS [Flavobacteriales bacterium]|nr:DNA mismatch repair protein MutS [Flavobacteriales bacterium]
MKQYSDVKQKHPGALVLFRVGDFYETFGEDAVKSSKILGITLTKRSNGKASEVELAGFPHHSLDVYLPRLVRAGQRVAICDQLEDPKQTKVLVKRGVTEVVTPGVSVNDKILESKQNNYLTALYPQKDQYGVSFIDISTGEFLIAEGDKEYIEKLFQNLLPSEVIFPKGFRNKFQSEFGEFYTYALDDWIFDESFANDKLLNQFKTETIKGFGIENLKLGIVAAGAILHYLNQNQQHNLTHLHTIQRLDKNEFVWLDSFTARNLELILPSHPQGISLLDILDHTQTPMGARLLRKWLVMPLLDPDKINYRLDLVEFGISHPEENKELQHQLARTGDLERLITKVSLHRINPREVIALKKALEISAKIRQYCLSTSDKNMVDLGNKINPCSDLAELISNSISDDPPVLPHKGGIFKNGYNDELDELRSIAYSGKDYLLGIQKREAERTGIANLRISFNNVFGYYLEVTNSHKEKVPVDWVRKQTLTNAERYITTELKEYEDKILNAEERIYAIESELYQRFVDTLSAYFSPILTNAKVLSQLDCISNFAWVATQNNYCKPLLNLKTSLVLKDCRHPVIEKRLPAGEEYIPNDIYLDREATQIIILTGPNMSGKSAVLRQTALAVLMAQIGCFVPAKYAEIGLVDKIYTRVGASDNISQGESTFMVEMIETASILNNLSERSLVILDEIGRGTSTFDGVSLAWAIAEYLNQHKSKPKTIFATHYHELNELENKNPGIVNYHITTRETGNKVIFLRKLLKGGSEHSFGIHVAKMAGIPSKVVNRAAKILEKLEKDRAMASGKEVTKNLQKHDYQMNLFQYNDPKLVKISDTIKAIDTNTISPIEALLKLNELKQELS